MAHQAQHPSVMTGDELIESLAVTPEPQREQLGVSDSWWAGMRWYSMAGCSARAGSRWRVPRCCASTPLSSCPAENLFLVVTAGNGSDHTDPETAKQHGVTVAE
jgi:hypothetical protein